MTHFKGQTTWLVHVKSAENTIALYSGGAVHVIYFELYILEVYMDGNSTS